MKESANGRTLLLVRMWNCKTGLQPFSFIGREIHALTATKFDDGIVECITILSSHGMAAQWLPVTTYLLSFYLPNLYILYWVTLNSHV